MLTRSVLTASPADLSFASRSDDFGGASTTQDIDDLDESDLSPSLLYCLDGNEPSTSMASPFASSNGRKRSALKSALPGDAVGDDNKENMENGVQEEHSRTKKLLITSPEEYPGETAL